MVTCVVDKVKQKRFKLVKIYSGYKYGGFQVHFVSDGSVCGEDRMSHTGPTDVAFTSPQTHFVSSTQSSSAVLHSLDENRNISIKDT